MRFTCTSLEINDVGSRVHCPGNSVCIGAGPGYGRLNSIVCPRFCLLRFTRVSLQGVARFRLDGVEADDVIATLALRALRAGMLVDIASPDKVSACPGHISFASGTRFMSLTVK